MYVRRYMGRRGRKIKGIVDVGIYMKNVHHLRLLLIVISIIIKLVVECIVELMCKVTRY